MPNEEQSKIETKTQEPTKISYEILTKRIDELEARNKELEEIIVDTQKVVRSNLTYSKSEQPEKDKSQESLELKKKLYSNLKIKEK